MNFPIQKIQIRSFRSIQSLTVRPDRLAILVGKNDTGKSNILRALDLFFNRKVLDAREFEKNYSKFSTPGKKKAKRIRIKIEVPLPKSYISNNGDYVIWTRTWKSGKEFEEEIVGKRYKKPYEKSIKISSRSNVKQFLDNIRYMYVPAIKDTTYFSRLQGDIYESISSGSSDDDFITSSRDFQKAISIQVKSLIDEIDNLLNIKSSLTLPNDLSHIFRSLDFIGGQSSISLNDRGDGIKTRHIPIILKFICDKIKESKSRQPYPNFIWGYEEPENNLEMSNCAKLADQLYSYLGNGISQIFLTTHSPVIYNMGQSKGRDYSNISRHQIYLDSKSEETEVTEVTRDLDFRMGVTAHISPIVSNFLDKYNADLDEVEREKLVLIEERKNNLYSNPTIFVEGVTDKLIYQRALSVFAPSHADKICIRTNEDEGAGIDYVITKIRAWRDLSKDAESMYRAVGILDYDRTPLKSEVHESAHNEDFAWAKFFKLRVKRYWPKHMLDIDKAGFTIPLNLESYYDVKTWEYAKSRGFLVPRNVRNAMGEKLMDDILAGRKNREAEIQDNWRVYVENQFSDERTRRRNGSRRNGKKIIAEWYSKEKNISDDMFRQRLSCLETLIKDIVEYLV